MDGNILERRLIDPLLHDLPELVIDRIEVRAAGGPQIWRSKFELHNMLLSYRCSFKK